MNKPETRFYEQIRNHKVKPPGPWWHMARLESSTAPGIPDVSAVSYKFLESEKELVFTEFWLEFKAQPGKHPRVRPSQFQWLLKGACLGRNCWLINRNPDTRVINLWKFHDQMDAERKSAERIAILDIPTFTYKTIEELIATPPERFRVKVSK